MSRDYRILVLGDHKAGKTSLINTFLKDVPYVPEASSSKSSLQAASPFLPVVSFPALHGGTLYIVDSPDVASQDKSSVNLPSWHQHELDRADAVVLVCPQYDDEGFSTSARKWLEAIRSSTSSSKRRTTRDTPVVIAASKSDDSAAKSQGIHNSAIQKAFPEVEAIVACSSVNNSNVAEGELLKLLLWHNAIASDISFWPAFWHAQQAVESPLHPLYDAEEKHLKPPAREAFNRIFALLAHQDSHLRPAAIQELQYRVFHQHISASEIILLLKQTLKPSDRGSVDESADAEHVRLSRDDFEAFICALLGRNRAEPVWRILRYYGYDTHLALSKSYLHPRLSIPSDGSECVELSQAGLDFLSQLCDDFSSSATTHESIQLQDFLLSAGLATELCNQLSSCPSLENFMGRWQALAATDISLLLESFARLGYPQSESIETIQPPKKGQAEYRNVLSAIKTVKRDRAGRRVFTCLVYGNAQSRNELSKLAGDVIPLGGGSYFVLVPVEDASLLPAKRLNQVDLAIYAYMNSDDTHPPSSIDYLVSIRETASQKLLDMPSLVVGLIASSDESEKQGASRSKEVAPGISQEAVDFCTAARLASPLLISSMEALRPELAKRASTRRRSRDGVSGSASWLLWSSALVAGVAAGYVLLQRTGWLMAAQRYLQDRS
ncbi:hypothetical protein P389DRAFT_198662 [Cystobasidium minutum MCA 4210]|uniref:uncharacterized protein n=1 Tax=Cystobasidium minutum MCA 4210 TaxID=1397322 RepID=UPI0034CEAE3A|eukprot:jgi/Rhomi1/198662/gm1.6876_g